MKLLFVCQNLNSGGAEKVISILSNHFIQNNSVNILMISPNPPAPFYELNNKIVVDSIYEFAGQNKLSKGEKLKAIKQYLKSNDFDVVIPFLDFVTIYTYYALKKFKNIKLIVSERCDPAQGSFAERLLKKHIYKKADGCVFQTEDAQKYYGKKIKNGMVIPNPVSINIQNKFDYHLLERKHEIIMVGSKKMEKNRMMAYKAFAILHANKSLKDYILKIYGETTEQEDSDVLSNLGIKDNVVFMGQKQGWHQECVDSAAFILTSDYEGMPNALLEAAALQIPCVSTDCPVGGPRYILKNGERGILVPVNNYKALAESLIKLVQDRELQNKYSDANKNTIIEFDKETISMQWEKLLRGLVHD